MRCCSSPRLAALYVPLYNFDEPRVLGIPFSTRGSSCGSLARRRTDTGSSMSSTGRVAIDERDRRLHARWWCFAGAIRPRLFAFAGSPPRGGRKRTWKLCRRNGASAAGASGRCSRGCFSAATCTRPTPSSRVARAPCIAQVGPDSLPCRYSIVVFPIVSRRVPGRCGRSVRQHGYLTAADLVAGLFRNRVLALMIALTGHRRDHAVPVAATGGARGDIRRPLGLHASINVLGHQMELPLLVAFLVMAGFTYHGGIRRRPSSRSSKTRSSTRRWSPPSSSFPRSSAGMVGSVRRRAWGKADHPARAARDSLDPAVCLCDARSRRRARAVPLSSRTDRSAWRSPSGAGRDPAQCRVHADLRVRTSVLLLLGFMALAAGVKDMPAFADGFARFGNLYAVPALFNHMFPPWFVGVAFADIAIGALVRGRDHVDRRSRTCSPATSTGRISRPNCSSQTHETSSCQNQSRCWSRPGRSGFVTFFPETSVVHLQLIGGIWICPDLAGGWRAGPLFQVAESGRAACRLGHGGRRRHGDGGGHRFQGLSVYTLRIFDFEIPCYLRRQRARTERPRSR